MKLVILTVLKFLCFFHSKGNAFDTQKRNMPAPGQSPGPPVIGRSFLPSLDVDASSLNSENISITETLKNPITDQPAEIIFSNLNKKLTEANTPDSSKNADQNFKGQLKTTHKTQKEFIEGFVSSQKSSENSSHAIFNGRPIFKQYYDKTGEKDDKRIDFAKTLPGMIMSQASILKTTLPPKSKKLTEMFLRGSSTYAPIRRGFNARKKAPAIVSFSSRQKSETIKNLPLNVLPQAQAINKGQNRHLDLRQIFLLCFRRSRKRCFQLARGLLVRMQKQNKIVNGIRAKCFHSLVENIDTKIKLLKRMRKRFRFDYLNRNRKIRTKDLEGRKKGKSRLKEEKEINNMVKPAQGNEQKLFWLDNAAMKKENVDSFTTIGVKKISIRRKINPSIHHKKTNLTPFEIHGKSTIQLLTIFSLI